MIIIALFALLFIIAVYKSILETIPGFLNSLLLLGAVGIAALILAGIVILFVRPTFSQRKRIKKAIKQDEEDSQTMSIRMDERNKKLNDEIRALRTELAEHEAKVRANNVLGTSDKNLTTVKWIIEKIESRRADSVKEALLLHDEKRRRDNAFELKLLQSKLEMDRKGREALENATRELNETINRKIYERDMKRLEEKKLEELREINEKLSR